MRRVNFEASICTFCKAALIKTEASCENGVCSSVRPSIYIRVDSDKQVLLLLLLATLITATSLSNTKDTIK